MRLYDRALECSQFIKSIYNDSIDYSIVLGSGLKNFEKEIEVINEIQYEDLPHFPITTVKGHSGKLIIGKIKGKTVICQSGRFHYYEGYNVEEITFPIRVFNLLNVKKLIVTNAAGGLNPNQEAGDIVIIKDHINFHPIHPLRGENEERFGTRFPDMTSVYDKEMIAKALEYGKRKNYKVEKGVYVGVQGPTFETPAEYKMYHIIGGDAIGMSTVPEVIVAKHMDMKIFGISIIADCGYPEHKMTEISHDEVLKQGVAAEPKVTDIVLHIIDNIG